MGNEEAGERSTYQATGYHMIKTLDIERYRCFASARLRDCRRVNIIVGDNGSGKTSLLEALLLVAGPSPALVFRMRAWRGFEGAVQGSAKDIEEALWLDLFHNFEYGKGVSIAARGDHVHTRRLTITYRTRDVYVPLSDRAPIALPNKAPVTFRWNIAQRNPVEVTPRIEDGTVKIPPTPEPPTETFFFAANHTYSSAESAARLSNLSKKSKEGEVISSFRKHYPNIEDLSVNLSAGAPMIFAKVFGLPEKVPLTIVSGGMNKLAALLLSFPTSPRCIVLIDEIDNGIYFRRLPEIWDTLLTFCERYDAQIFASTHNGECLAAAAIVAEKHPEQFSVIHAGPDGSLRQFYGDQFTEAMNENIEIR